MIKVLQKYKKRVDIHLLAVTFFIILLGLITLSGSNLDTSNTVSYTHLTLPTIYSV